ncbi:hypothetical protein AB0M87_21430 [Streptomyces sp. NPDC051320]|uniref:hypothetical protein n=1 Tax=Streptomyces sp. NPDC051320 TaxID=3154644 RepID=UPI0034307D0E
MQKSVSPPAPPGARRPVFVVAHRLSTIRGADRIVVMESGRIAEIGTHEELIVGDGVYRGLQTVRSR